jgi:transcriptional regulator with XRE-family HTH domain
MPTTTVYSLRMNLGGRLKLAREFRRMTQEQLAELASTDESPVSQAAISALESRDSETSTFLFRLSKVLRVNPEWLQDGRGRSGLDDEPPPHELARVTNRTRSRKTQKVEVKKSSFKKT